MKENREYVCDICEDVFGTEEELREHKLDELDENNPRLYEHHSSAVRSTELMDDIFSASTSTDIFGDSLSLGDSGSVSSDNDFNGDGGDFGGGGASSDF